MKLSIRIPLPLLGLPLLLGSIESLPYQLPGGDASMMSNGGFMQAMPNIQPFAGQQEAAPGQLLQVAGTAVAGAGALQQGAPAATGLAPAAAPASGESCHCQESGSSEVGSTCSVSKVTVHQDHAANQGISLASVSAIWGSSTLSPEQREKVTLAKVSESSFMCLDDRVTQPSLATPGGDLGEFILALSSYLQERDPTGRMLPSQEVVDALLSKYLQQIPDSRPMVHCTDDRAISHLEAEMPMENLDLNSPPDHVKASLLEKLTEVENHGDSHIRLMLKQPQWFQLNEFLAPMAVKSFYRLLWERNPKLKLHLLVGQSDPMAFLEVSSGELCHSGGVAPMLTPRTPERSVLISHLDAVSLRRQELAAFFTRIANASPRKINKDQLHQRLDRHGWLALETTGSRIASGLPFYTLTYT